MLIVLESSRSGSQGSFIAYTPYFQADSAPDRGIDGKADGGYGSKSSRRPGFKVFLVSRIDTGIHMCDIITSIYDVIAMILNRL